MKTTNKEDSLSSALSGLSLQSISNVGNRVFQALRKSEPIEIPEPRPAFGQNNEYRNRKGMIMSTTPVMTTPLDELPTYTLKEVSYHDNLDDCWVVIYDRIYDITNFIYEHPGGDDVMMEYAGRDATLAFRSVGHSKMAEMALEPFLVGALPPKEQMWSRLLTTRAENR
jgi:cytochrome b involved in lipid metabolism